MKIKELLKKCENEYYSFEIYKIEGDKFHTDFIKNIDNEYSIKELKEMEVKDYELMNEEDYNNTILTNSCENANFEELYGKKDAVILVIGV